MTPPTTPIATVEDLVSHEEGRLLPLRQRLTFLQAIESEIQRRVGSSTVDYPNDLLWYGLLDQRDILIIHFASWIRGMAETGGFFGKLRNCGGRALFVAVPAKKLPMTERYVAGLRRKRFTERFPKATDGRVSNAEIDELKEEFWSKGKPVVDDRDSIRAHAFEQQTRSSVPKMLNLQEASAIMTFAQDMLNDIRLFGHNSTFGYGDGHPIMSAHSAAEDLVDLLMFGQFANLISRTGCNTALYEATHAYWWQHRSALYAAMADVHAERTRKGEELSVNDPQILIEAESRVASGNLARAASAMDPWPQHATSILVDDPSRDD